MARRRQQLLPWIFSGTLLVAAVGLVVAKLQEVPHPCPPGGGGGAGCSYDPAPRPPQDPAAHLFMEAKNSIRAGKWTDARASLLKIKAFSPDMPGLEDYLERVEKEVREAQALLDAQQPDQAVAIADDVLATFPDNLAARRISDVKPRAKADPPPYRVPSWEEIVDRFASGDVDGAITLAQECADTTPSCKTGLRNLTEFASLDKDPAALDSPKLKRLLELEKLIQGPIRPSRVVRSAGQMAARIFYQGAVKAKAAGQWARASEYAQQTLQADRSHEGAKAMLAELREKARQSFLKASALAPTHLNSAILKLREVVALTPPEDELHQKAQLWISQLSK